MALCRQNGLSFHSLSLVLLSISLYCLSFQAPSLFLLSLSHCFNTGEYEYDMACFFHCPSVEKMEFSDFAFCLSLSSNSQRRGSGSAKGHVHRLLLSEHLFDSSAGRTVIVPTWQSEHSCASCRGEGDKCRYSETHTQTHTHTHTNTPKHTDTLKHTRTQTYGYVH